jgi:NAD dependent epimerase/dehydratase family enzyme
VTGATGVIGRHAIGAMLERGDQVVVLTRDPDSARDKLGGGVEAQAWADPKHTLPPSDALDQADAILHLLGEPIAQRWTDDAKREIRDSRVLSTRSLVEAIAALPEDRRPRALVSQSATGYYGPRSTSRTPRVRTFWPA